MVQPETQTLLASLQPLVEAEIGWLLRLPYHEDGGELYPFVWAESEQGEFNLWNLLQAEGWSQVTDLETALEKWCLPDRTGTVNGETGLLPSRDEAEILLDQPTKAARIEHYQALIDLLQANLQNLAAFQLSPTPNPDADAFSVVVLAGQADGVWISVAPNIPHATPDRDFPFQTESLTSPFHPTLSSTLEPQIQAILSQLGTVQVYGYYGGGYNQVHDHKLVYAIGETLATAMERVLNAAGGVETRTFAGFRLKANRDSAQTSKLENLEQFLHQSFSQLRLDRICFWNQENFYISGAQAGDRLGVVLRSRFTYNP